MQDLVYNKKLYFIPSTWNELTAKQLFAITHLLHTNYTPEYKEYLLLKAMLGFGNLRYAFLPNDAKYRMMPFVEWIANKEEVLTELPFNCYSKNIFSSKLFAPAKAFENLTMLEFHYTEVAYKFLIETDDEKYLNELIAVLFRHKKENYDTAKNSDGDCRIAFNPNEIDYRVKIVKPWKLSVKQAILLWYDGCRQTLIKDYAEVYSGTSEGSNYYAGLYTMIRSLAGDKYGTIDKIEQLNVITAHLECSILLEESEKQKAQLNTNSHDL
jgi:hypothetical protein